MKYKEASTSVKTPIVPLQLQFYFPELQGVFQHKTSQNSLVIFASEGKSGRWGFVVQPFKNTHTFPSFYKATPYHDWALYLFVLRPPLHLYLSFCYFLSLIQFLCEPRREIPVEKREGGLSACLPTYLHSYFFLSDLWPEASSSCEVFGLESINLSFSYELSNVRRWT